MHRSISTPRLRLVCLVLCLSLLMPLTLFTRSVASEDARADVVTTVPLALPSKTAATTTARRRIETREGEVLVRFREDVSEKDKDAFATSFVLKRAGKLRGKSRVERLALLVGQSLDALLPALKANPSIEFAEPNFIITADEPETLPKDARFPDQWALSNAIGVNAASARPQITGSSSTVIAIIDSGVDFSHHDLRDNQWTHSTEKNNDRDAESDGYGGDLHGWDWVADSPESNDEGGHGTAIAGIIAATSNNAAGVTGVVSRASLMNLRVLNKENKGSVADAVEAIDYAVAKGAQIINCSWGLDEDSIALRQAITRAVMSNVTVVCSAGNGGHDLTESPRYPASYDIPFVISVAATGRNDELTSTSNWGATHVAVAAPGEALLTTKAGGGYDAFSGSSAAAATVSGVAGLVRTLRPRLSAERTQQMILIGARKVSALEDKVMSNGVVDIRGALAAFSHLQSGEGLADGVADADPETRGDGTQSGTDAEASGAGVEGVKALPQGRPQSDASDLPDLNSARNRPRRDQQVVSPVPSTRRRCPPHNRRCNDTVQGAPQSTPIPTPSPKPSGQGNPHLLASVAGLALLEVLGAAMNGGRPLIDVPLLDYFAGYSASDSAPAPTLLTPASYSPEPAMLPQSQETPEPFVTGMVGGAMRSDSPGWTGFKVTTGAQPLTLTALGRRCLPGNSLLHELRLIRASDNVLFGTTSVSMSGCTQGQFKYEDLPSPVTLAANTAYLVVSYESGSDNFHDWSGTVVSTTSVATVNHGVYTTDGGQTWGPAGGTGNSYVPVSFKYQIGMPSVSFVTGRVVGAMRADSPGWTGFKITTAAQPLTVTSLGRLCLPGNALSHDLKVIRSSDNATLATTTVSMSGCTQGQFKYANLPSPVTLAASTAYLVVSYEAGTDNFHDWSGTAVTTTSVATVNHGVYTVNGGQTWGPAGGTGNTYVPVDFKYQTAEQGVGTGLTAKYYDEINFTSHKLTRTDPTINFDWANGTPLASMGADQFSVRWMGMISPRYSQTYTFYTTTDDGVRLWVDGLPIIDKWIDQAPTQWSGQITLEAGRQYDIRMDFYENFGGASAKLEWQSASQAREVVPQTRLYSCWKNIDQFVKEFYQAALARQPNPTELQDWSGRLARAQGEVQLVEQARTLGVALFDLSPSSEYSARNRSNGDFVADLYRGYLQRDPEQAGWQYWTGQVALPNGRANVREAFNLSIEFYEKVRRLCDSSVAADVNGGTGYDFSTARLDPDNRTGGGGADPLSRNFNWSVPLVSLPGRAGLDLGLSLSYNSLVWTKDATGITFDADEGFPGPGFRLGFPVVQPKFFNPKTGKYAYLLITPSGGRAELRQVGSSNIYESADSAYLQVTEVGGVLTLSSTDGTRLTLNLLGGQYRCTQIKDRNGNYISASYFADGRLDKVSDTLGRTLTFTYDAFQNIISITQPWKRETAASPTGVDETHTWATFGYTNLTLQPSFSNLTVMGDQPGTVIPVVTQLGMDDGSYYKFSYNAWGQIWKVTHFAADSVVGGVPQDTHALSYTRLNLPGSDLQSPTPQTDCPRFTTQGRWIENGVMNQSAETTTSYSSWTPNMASCDITPPDPTPTVSTDNVVYRETYATTGWQKGLTTNKKVLVNGTQRKWTDITWQDDTNGAYPNNPRVTDMTVHDSENHHRRTSTSYYTFTLPSTTSCSLPQNITEWDSTTTIPLRTTRVEYNDATDYTSRRIIGLPLFTYIYEGGVAPANLRSKVEYKSDELNDGSDTFLASLPSSATQHDGTNYGTGFRWRGNVNRVRTYEVNQLTGAVSGSYIENRVGHKVTGSVAYTKDGLGHGSTMSYTDSFFQSVNRSNPSLQTFAYPTTITDPDNFSSTSSYNYDMGVTTQSTDAKNAIMKTRYDSAGRTERTTRRDGVNGVDKGYTSMVYPTSMTMVQSYTLTDASKPEAYSVKVLDGAGRVRATAADHLNGSVWTYSAQLFDFDAVGQLVRQSKPTETTATGGTWPATGDDDPATGGSGWIYTVQAYDWKGRPTVTTNTADSTSRSVSYEGCGCAGGEVTTVTDEVGKRQRITADVLGRENKLEDLNPDDTVYRTATTTYNVRDEITQSVQRIGTNGTLQTTTTDYDGYGRVWKNRLPQASASTVFTYNADSSLNVQTDARGATATYSYNNRGLTTGVTYLLAGDVWSVGFGYDSVGNRTSMTDGMGPVTYNYDTVSRMTSETRGFPETGHSFTTNYEYNLADELTLITDHFGASVTYTRDRTGRLTDIPGYSTGIKYRAWGGLKEQTLTNGKVVSMGYDARMRMAQFNVPGVTGWNYQYYGDGKLQFSSNLQTSGTRDERLDRKLVYDTVGRLSQGLTGSQARGEATFPATGPYKQNLTNDVWDHLTFRDNQRGSLYNSYNATYVDNKNTNAGWQYDANGTLTRTQEGSSITQYTYNCASHMTSAVMTTSSSTTTILSGYDGDGRRVKKIETGAPTIYYVRSAALGGQVLDEVDASGAKLRGYVYQEGKIIAKQEGAATQWDVRDPANNSNFMLNSAGVTVSHVELDPLGTTVDPNNPSYSQNPSGFYGGPSLQGTYCRVNSMGVSVPCSLAQFLNSINFGATVYVNGSQTPLTMAQGMAEMGWLGLTPQDIVFGNPWDLNNTPAGGSSGPMGNYSFNWGAYNAGYLWMGGSGSYRSSRERPGFSVRGAFVQVPQGSLRPDLPDYARSIYTDKDLGKALTDCINSVFGKEAELSGGRKGVGSQYLPYQQLKNAPTVKFADLGPGRLGTSSYLDIGTQSITLSSNNIVDHTDKATGATVSAFEIGQRAYVHELGNYLSRTISFGGSATTFGDPNGIEGRNGTKPDTDTGAALEKCVFGDVFP